MWRRRNAVKGTLAGRALRRHAAAQVDAVAPAAGPARSLAPDRDAPSASRRGRRAGRGAVSGAPPSVRRAPREVAARARCAADQVPAAVANSTRVRGRRAAVAAPDSAPSPVCSWPAGLLLPSAARSPAAAWRPTGSALLAAAVVRDSASFHARVQPGAERSGSGVRPPGEQCGPALRPLAAIAARGSPALPSDARPAPASPHSAPAHLPAAD